MKKLGAVVAIAAVMMLSGCSAATTAEPAPAETALVTPAPEATQAARTAPEETASPYGEYTQDEFYVEAVSTAWRGEVPPPEDITAAGRLACEQMLSGTPKAAVTVFSSGDEAAWNNEKIVYQAAYIYCPEVG